MNSPLSLTTRALHWGIAIVFIILMGVGIYMHENRVFELYPTHKSIGTILFALIIIRVWWRIREGWPPSMGTDSRLMQRVAHVIHWVLIIGTVLMPVSGLLMSIGGGQGVIVFGWEIIAPTIDPATGKAVEVIPWLHKAGHIVHGITGKVLLLAIVLHLMGALKHHIINKDGVLKRMIRG